MRIVFMGTPEFAVPSLRKLAREHDVALVLTRPDAVRGRGKKLEPSPVKAAARELGIEVLETTRITQDVRDALEDVCADIFCVAAYGCILPDSVLHLAPCGIVNVHASLLPRWRGAAPIQRAILSGDEEAGVSIMRIGHGVDTGAYCAQASCGVAGKSTEELTSELAVLGADLLCATLPAIEAGSAVWVEQDDALVTHAAKVDKAEMHLDPYMSRIDVYRHVLASSDTAPARCSIAGKHARILGVSIDVPGNVHLECGEVARIGKRLYLGCADGAVELMDIKPDGKREMPAAAWAAGIQVASPTWEKIA